MGAPRRSLCSCSGSPKDQHRCLEPPEARPRVCWRKPQPPPTGQGSLCARVLGAYFQECLWGSLSGPRYLQHPRPQTSSRQGDMIIGPVTPLHAVPASAKGHLQAASMPMVGRTLYPRGRRGEGGGKQGGALLIHAGIGGPGACHSASKAPWQGTSPRQEGPAPWAVEMLSSL